MLWTPAALFDQVLPWLLLVATMMLAFGRQIGPALRARFRAGLTTILGLQFLLGIYGGYFGGAVGLMMMAVWSILDGAEVKALNAPRTLMVSAANGVAVLSFIAGWRCCVDRLLLVGTRCDRRRMVWCAYWADPAPSLFGQGHYCWPLAPRWRSSYGHILSRAVEV